MASTSEFSPLDLPIGFRFAPKNEELILILRQRQQNVFSNHPIHHVNVYDSTPQELSERFQKGNDRDEWFFMTERVKVRKGGKNQKRGNNEGYWKARQTAERIDAGNGLIGYMRQLVYMTGKKPNIVKTDWRMNEYWFMSSNGNDDKVDYALCKIFLTPRATKKKNSQEDNEAVENEEDLAMVDHDADVFAEEIEQLRYLEYQEPQSVPQSDRMMMLPEGEQQKQQQVTWSSPLPPQDPQGQDSGLGMDMYGLNDLVPEDNYLRNVFDYNNFNVFDEDDWRNVFDEDDWCNVVDNNNLIVPEDNDLRNVSDDSNFNAPDEDDLRNVDPGFSQF